MRKSKTSREKSSEQLLVEAHLAARGLKDKWLYERIGMNKGSYYDMWRRDTTRLPVLRDIAGALGMDLPTLLSTPQVSKERAERHQLQEPSTSYGRPRYIEERISDLEERMAAMERKK